MQHVKKLPGFRSGSRRNAIIASVVYVLVIVAIINLLTGGGSDDAEPVKAAASTATNTAIAPAATVVPPTEIPAMTATPEPTRAPLMTADGPAFVDKARGYLAELKSHIADAETGQIDEIAWSTWVRDWNQRRQTDYEACLAAKAGIDACAPLDIVRALMVAEHNLLWNDGDVEAVNELRAWLAEHLPETP